MIQCVTKSRRQAIGEGTITSWVGISSFVKLLSDYPGEGLPDKFEIGTLDVGMESFSYKEFW